MAISEEVMRSINLKGGFLDFDDDTREFTVIVTSEVVDSQGEIVDWESIQSVLPKIRERGYAVNYAHFGVYVGHSIDVWESTFGTVMGLYPETVEVLSKYNPSTRCLIGKNKIHKGAEIDDIAWEELKSGKINGVSFGGTFKELNKTECDGVTCGKVISTDKAIFELALTGDGLGTNGVGIPSEKPANPTSIILALKSLNVKQKAFECPPATKDIELNTENRNNTIEKFKYGPLNVDAPGDYWEDIAVFWDTEVESAKQSLCANCVAFDISPQMKDCMPGDTFDDDGELGYCWMHHFKCHSARTCSTWAKGGPIEKDEESNVWAERNKPNTKADPCWDGYEQRGMKRGKGGKLVPNCVPTTKAPKKKKKPKKNDPQTPAPKKDQIFGSDTNKPGSASGQRGGIKLSESQIKSIKKIVDEHNEKVKEKNMADWKKMTMGQAKAVVLRGMGAFSVSHRPNVSSRTQWGLGRLNAFSKLLISGKPKNAKYVGDNDLLPEEHKRSTKKSKSDDAVLTTTPNFLDTTYGGGRASPQDEERRRKLEQEMAKLKSGFAELYLYDSLKSHMKNSDDHLYIPSNNTVELKVKRGLFKFKQSGDEWWNSLTPSQQQAYIQKHPQSKYAKQQQAQQEESSQEAPSKVDSRVGNIKEIDPTSIDLDAYENEAGVRELVVLTGNNDPETVSKIDDIINTIDIDSSDKDKADVLKQISSIMVETHGNSDKTKNLSSEDVLRAGAWYLETELVNKDLQNKSALKSDDKTKSYGTNTQDGNPPSRTDYQQAKTMDMMVALMERLNHLDRVVNSSHSQSSESVVEQQQAPQVSGANSLFRESKGYVEAQDISDVTDKENMIMENKNYQKGESDEITTKMLYEKMMELEKKVDSYYKAEEEEETKGYSGGHSEMKAEDEEDTKAYHDTETKAHHDEMKADEEEESKAMHEKADEEEEESKAMHDEDTKADDDEDVKADEDEDEIKSKSGCGCGTVKSEAITNQEVQNIVSKAKEEIFAEIGAKSNSVKTPSTQVDGQVKIKSSEKAGATLSEIVSRASQKREFAPDIQTLMDYAKQ